MNNETKTITADLAEWMPCVYEQDDWQEAVPASLREPAQQIAGATAESFEVVLALVLTFFGVQLRGRRRIYDHRGKSISPELNLLLVHPEKALSISWYEMVCDTLVRRDTNEHSFIGMLSPGVPTKVNGFAHFARESQILSEVTPYEILRKLKLGEMPVAFLHSTATALEDELNRLTRLEKKNLSRILNLSWNKDRVGTGKEAFAAGVGLLWAIDGDELEAALPAFYQSNKPAPVLLLNSTANREKPPRESLSALLNLQDDIWQILDGEPLVISPTPKSAENLLSFAGVFEDELRHLPSKAGRRNLGFIPGLCYRIVCLLAPFADRDEETLITAAKGMTGALARRHFSTLHKFTAGFTAEPRRDPENPAELVAEYTLLAKIEKYAPVTRTRLNKMCSNENRKRLDERLARLISNGRVAVDDQGRFSVRSVMSV